jgi:hypothetical protein
MPADPCSRRIQLNDRLSKFMSFVAAESGAAFSQASKVWRYRRCTSQANEIGSEVGSKAEDSTPKEPSAHGDALELPARDHRRERVFFSSSEKIWRQLKPLYSVRSAT